MPVYMCFVYSAEYYCNSHFSGSGLDIVFLGHCVCWFVQEVEIDCYVTDFDVTSSCYAWENLYQGPQYRANAGLHPQPRSRLSHTD